MRTEQPATAREAADLLHGAAAGGTAVRFRGGGTKFDWGTPGPEPDLLVSTAGLGRIVEHNAADLTAVLEAGVPLADAQEAFAEAGQMLAMDPPLGLRSEATIGGVVATGDSGPLRHRYGAIRDLLLGMTVTLSDGTVAKSGGKVIKNVAGYDLAKLFAGSFGTLGMIVQVAVRLHPRPRNAVTAVGFTDDPDALQAGAVSLAGAPLELESLDAQWEQSTGRVAARCAGPAAGSRIEKASRLMDRVEVLAEDVGLWTEFGRRQRSGNGTVVRVSGLPSQLARLSRVVMRLQGSFIARAGLGVAWVRLRPADVEGTMAAVGELRREMAPHPCVILDAPREVREKVPVWGEPDGSVRLMGRIRERFDPAGICNPGVFVV